MRAREDRLRRYMGAADTWAAAWPRVEAKIAALPLGRAHALVPARTEGILPYVLPGEHP